jgi:hypothetical protein
MNLQRHLTVQDECVPETATKWRLSQNSMSTRSSRQARELDSYIVAAVGLALIILLSVGAAGFAAARAAFRDAPLISIQSPPAAHTHAADISTFGTPAALALGLLGLIALSVATTPSRSKIVSRLRTREPQSMPSTLANREPGRASSASPLI